MSVIPIDEAAIEKAAHVFRNHNSDGTYVTIEERLSAAVSAYLEAVRAEVETMHGPDGPEQRTCTPWKPLTDTEEPFRARVDRAVERNSEALDLLADSDTEEETNGR